MYAFFFKDLLNLLGSTSWCGIFFFFLYASAAVYTGDGK